ncbi:TonB-dependent receptor [Novosphingobium sp.]|uniref:TonB-dependent receptor n=1 Tax=Novosphingobium sp. TaxID=1874826 RepID=UPI003D146372
MTSKSLKLVSASVLALCLMGPQSGYAADAAGKAPEKADNDQAETIVVTASRQEDASRATQKIAPVLVNIQSIETIKKYPDFNAAEALGRIPGISLSTDTGEGRFVNIRGIDANLNGATYGGVVLLNTFPAGTAASGSGRAVEFDTVPTGAIDGIVVYKTLSPDREAEGLGGQIDLTPRTARNITKPFVEIELGAGYEPLHHHAGPYTGSIAVGAKMGDFSFVLTGSRKDDNRGVDDTEPSYANDGACGVNGGTSCGAPLDRVLGRADFRRYDYDRRRFGYGGELDYAPSADHHYYARVDVAGYIERALKDHFYANFDGNPSAPDAQGYVVDRFQPQIDIVNLQETHRNTVAATGGEDRFGDLQIDYRAAYSRATYNEGYYNEARFYGSDTYYGRYNNTADPKRFYYQFFQDAALTVPFNSFDTSQYGGANGKVALSSFSEHDADYEYSGVFNARYPVALFGSTGTVKAGISIRRRTKNVYDFAGFNTYPAGSTVVLSDYAQNAPQPYNYYYGRYPTSPIANYAAIANLVNTGIPTLSPSLGRDFNDKENITAGYAMYTVDYGKLDVLTGVRVEVTSETYGNYLTTTDVMGNSSTSFVNNIKKYTNIFPTLQLKYQFSNELQLRAIYSTGIARPGFSQAGGNAGVDFTTAPRPVYSAGNPNLKPTTGNNFDLDLEYYLPHGGIIQVGVFDKEFKNYIFKSAQVNQPNPIFLGQNGDFVTYINESAYARGIEIAYQQKFAFLPGVLSGLGVEANLTLVKSHFREYAAAVSGDGTDQYGSLPGTSNVTWNLAGFYEKGPVSVRLSSQYVSASLFALNGDKSLDTIQAARLTMDLTSSYKVGSHYEVFFAAKNLLNTPLRYNDGAAYRTQQIEYYGATYEGGVRIKF